MESDAAVVFRPFSYAIFGNCLALLLGSFLPPVILSQPVSHLFHKWWLKVLHGCYWRTCSSITTCGSTDRRSTRDWNLPERLDILLEDITFTTRNDVSFSKDINLWNQHVIARKLICGSRRITGSWILRARMKGFWRHLHVHIFSILSYERTWKRKWICSLGSWFLVLGYNLQA